MDSLLVNGKSHEVSLARPRTLLYVLREELGITGPKYGCGEGECGVCTVLLDGRAVQSCKTSVQEVGGRSVTTIEGLAKDGRLHPLQQAFAEVGALQCGYCTPGMILAAADLLAHEPKPSDARVAEALQGHICRCGTYPRILRAVRWAQELGQGAPLAATANGDPLGPSEVEGQRCELSPLDFARGERNREAGHPAEGPWDLAEPNARSYFEALGDGLVAVVPPTPPRGGPPRGGGWVHLGRSGQATAFTGKIEMGQGAKTGFALLVAEELGLPLAAVRLVSGDTDLSPWDLGTFGSMSTAIAGQDLRKAAAGLRERLVGIAAGRWGLDRSKVLVADGQLREEDGTRSLACGEAVAGLHEVLVVTGEVPLTAADQWHTAGHDTPRLNIGDVVTGAKRYPSDLDRPGILHGCVLRPPAFGAKLRSADCRRARAQPGVTVLETEGFVGVASADLLDAREALGTIEAQWDLTPQPSEGELEAHLRSHPVESVGWEGPVHQEVGDCAGALAAAPVRVTATYRTAFIAHVPIEPRAALAEWDGERVTVHVGSQVPFMSRESLAEALGLPEASVRIVVPDFGDGFGGKQAQELALEAARLARATGKPVKVMWSREEEFTWGHFRPAAIIDVQSGAERDGRLAAWSFKNVNGGSAGVRTPYEVPNQSVHYQPAASPLKQGPYRALAATTNNFARESHLDELAHALGVDPLELRLRHLKDERLAAVFRAAAERAGWVGRGRRGMGIAGGIEKGGRVATCAEVEVEAGQIHVRRVVTAYDCGALVNPDAVRSQIEGATVMGLGGALFEAIHFEGGRILNPLLSRYRVPRFSDLPEIEVVLLNRPDQPSAGAGETPIIAVAPAIANALFAATGERRRSLPLCG
jgi:isoquinoline 1-oxidoreductase